MAAFFYFSGFETFITAGRNIDNSKRNVPLGFLIIMIIEIVFYSAFFVLMFVSIAPGEAVQREYIEFFNNKTL
jgi:amino acid transporter